MPDESADAVQIERAISAVQGQDFTRQGSRPVGPAESLGGLAVQPIVDRLSRVTERPGLHYRAFLYEDRDPNAAALADGRIYLSSGMVAYLAGRGAHPDELAFILGHELAHTVAQHLVKRYRTLQQEQALLALVAAGATAVTRNASASTQQAGQLAMDAASLLQNVANSGFSQGQELEADQLGIRYVIRAGFHPQAALDLLQDFERFDTPWPFLRTHPYIAQRRADLERYLEDTGQLRRVPTPPPPVVPTTGTGVPRSVLGSQPGKIRALRQVQSLYPKGSLSWQNLQRQIEALERR